MNGEFVLVAKMERGALSTTLLVLLLLFLAQFFIGMALNLLVALLQIFFQQVAAHSQTPLTTLNWRQLAFGKPLCY